jgi:hypothetical protein
MLDIFQSTAWRIPQKWPAGFARNSHKPMETYVFWNAEGSRREPDFTSSQDALRCLAEGNWDLVGDGSRKPYSFHTEQLEED